MTTITRGRRTGRPPLHRDRHTYLPLIDLDMWHMLKDQADRVDLPMATYLEHVVAAAHGYHGQHMRDLDAPLPTSVPATELRRVTKTLAADGCFTHGPSNSRVTIRLDRPLAEQVNRRCHELGVPYTDYLRGVLALAVGLHRPGRGIQTPLTDDLLGGAQRRRSA